MTTPRPDSRLGTDLGPYRIELVLGRGGMGVVYLAEQRELGRKVALKLLPDELAQDADFRARFERESRLAAAIDHPNVIPLYEAGEIEGTLFLAMRYVEGIDLATRLREGELPTATALAIVTQVAGALDAAHARGLVHRDVKPGNVLLDRAGGDDRPHAYLVDFGLTKQAGSESGLTRAGAFLGTPAYMAPEQVDGTEVDARADQYSLACLAFECLTGSVPFRREKEVAVALAHLKDPVPSAVALAPELPAAVDRVFAQAMAKDREARYGSCAAFADDLASALGGGAVRARPVRTAPRRRAPLAVAAVLGLGLVAVAGLAWASGGLGSSGSSSPSPSGSALAAAVPTEAPTPTASPTPDPSLYPNEAEQALLSRLPASATGDCERADWGDALRAASLFRVPPGARPGSGSGPPIAEPNATLRCVGVAGIDEAYYMWFRLAGPEGEESEDTAIGWTASTLGLASGDCDTEADAWQTWEAGGIPAGKVVCTDGHAPPEAAGAWVYWDVQEANVLAWASREDGDRDALMSWWRSVAPLIQVRP